MSQHTNNRLSDAQRRFTLNSSTHAIEFSQQNSTKGNHQRTKSMGVPDNHPSQHRPSNTAPTHRRTQSTGIVTATIDADYHPEPTNVRNFLGISIRRTKSQSGRQRRPAPRDEHGRARAWTRADIGLLEELTALSWGDGRVLNFTTVAREMNRTVRDVQDMLKQQARSIAFGDNSDFLSEFPRAIVLQWAGIEFPDDPLLGGYVAVQARRMLTRESCFSTLLCRAPRQVIPEVPILANTRFDHNRVPGDLYDEIRAQDPRTRADNALLETHHGQKDLRSSRSTQRVVTEPSAILLASSNNIVEEQPQQSASADHQPPTSIAAGPPTTRRRSKSTVVPKESSTLPPFQFSAVKRTPEPTVPATVSVPMHTPLSPTFGLKPGASEPTTSGRKSTGETAIRSRRRQSRSRPSKTSASPEITRVSETPTISHAVSVQEPASPLQPSADNRVSHDSGNVDDRTCGQISLIHKLRGLRKYAAINSDFARRLDRETRYTVRRAVSEFFCGEEDNIAMIFDKIVTAPDNSLFLDYATTSATFAGNQLLMGERFHARIQEYITNSNLSGIKAYGMVMYLYVLQAVSKPGVMEKPPNWPDIAEFAMEWANRKLTAARYIASPATNSTHIAMAAYYAGTEAGQCFFDIYRKQLAWRVTDKELHLLNSDHGQMPSGERTTMDLYNLRRIIDVWVEVAFRRNAANRAHLVFATAAELVNINMVLPWSNLANETDVAKTSLTFDRNCLEANSLYDMNDLRDLPDSSVANELARAFARKFYDNNREELFRLVLCQHHFLTPDYEEFAEWVSLGYGWAGGGTDFNMLVQMNQYLLSMKFKPIRKYWDAIRNDVVTSLCNLVHHSNTSFDWHSIDGFLWPREHAEKTNSSTGLPPDPTASTAMAVGFNHLLGPTKNESHVSPPINETSGDLGSMSLRSQRTIRRLDTEDAPLVPIPDLSHIPDAISLADQRHHSNPTIDAPAQAESLLASAKRRHTTYMSKATTVAAPGEDLPTVSKPTSSVFEEADPKGKRIEYDSPSASVTLQFSKIAQIVDANSPVRSDSTQQLTPEPFASARTSDHAESNASSLEFPVTSVAAASQPLAENLPQLTSQPQVSGSPKACTLADPNVSLQVPSRQEMVQTGQILKSSAFSYYDTPTISLPQPAGAQMPPVPTLNHPSSTHNQDTVEVLAAASMEVQGAPETVPLQAAQTHGDPHQRTYQPVLPAQYSSVGLAAQTIPSNSGYATPHILQQPYAYQQFPQPPPTQYPLQQLPPPSIASPQYLAPTWQPTTQPQYFQQQPIVQFAPQQPQLQYAPPPPQQQPGYPQQSQQGYPLQTTGPQPAQTPGHSVQPMGSPTAYPAQQSMSNFHLAQMNDAEWDRYTQRMEYQIQLTERLQRAQNPGWSS